MGRGRSGRFGQVRIYRAVAEALECRQLLNGLLLDRVGYTTPGTPTYVTSGDWNGDGHTDIAVCYGNTSGISVLMGDGAGGLAVRQNLATGGNPWRISSGDFDGDGKKDLVSLCQGDETVRIFYGDGLGDFSKRPASVTLAGSAISLAIGDFDGDHTDDLAIWYFNSRVQIILNVGGQPHLQPAFSVAGVSAMAVGDMNNDGTPDLITVGGNWLWVRVANGDGTFRGPMLSGSTIASGSVTPLYDAQSNTPELALADVNNDGNLDAVLTNASAGNVGVLLGNGDGTMRAERLFGVPGSHPAGLAIADFNNDGNLDLAVGDGGLTLLLGNGDGTFSGGGAYAAANNYIGSADIDGDGAADVVTSANGQINVWRQNLTAVTGPTIEFGAVRAMPNGDLEISYRLRDAESAACSITLGYSIYANGVYQDAPVASWGEGATALASSPSGVWHMFVWQGGFYVAANHPNLTVSLVATGAVPGPAEALSIDHAPSVSTPRPSVGAGQTRILAEDMVGAFYDNDWSDSLQRVVILSLPAHGTLMLGTVPVTARQEIAASDLTRLTYTAGSWTGDDSFQWSGQDGLEWAPQSAWFVITVKAHAATVLAYCETSTVQAGASAVVNVLVKSGSGAVPTGRVELSIDGWNVMGTADLVNGEASITLPVLDQGDYRLNAYYYGDSTYGAASSATPLYLSVTAATVVDLVAFYTPAAAAKALAMGSDIDSMAKAAVADANLALRNSKENVVLRLVGLELTQYAESGDYQTDLDRMSNATDGYMDEVPTLRATYGADLTTLFTGAPAGGFSGMSYQLGDLNAAGNAYWGYSAVYVGHAAAPNYSLAHEVGHNLGAAHNASDGGATGIFADARGYRLQGNDGLWYHDVMAYDSPTLGDIRIPYFSDPDLTYAGVAEGNAGTADAARAIAAGAVAVAGFRPTVLPVATGTSVSVNATRTVVAGRVTTVTATVTKLAGNPHMPTGTVTLLDGEAVLGTAALTGGVATWTGTLSEGTHTLRAVYENDDYFAGSISTGFDVQAYGPVLMLCGTGGNDVVTMQRSGGDLLVYTNGVRRKYDAAVVTGVLLDCQGGNDLMTVGAGVPNMVVYGGDGNDTIYTGAGDDTVFGGSGDDLLVGGDGHDALRGEDGNDTLSGEAGDDRLYGDKGFDLLYGGDGSDRLDGGTGNDTMWGGRNADLLTGMAGNDVLIGEDGKDTLLGGDQNDMMDGGSGWDSLDGGSGDDVMFAIDAVTYTDTVVGGGGNDLAHVNEALDVMPFGDVESLLA